MAESFLRDDRLDDAEAMFRQADQAKPNPGMLGYHLAQVEQARSVRDRGLAELNKYFGRQADVGRDGSLPVARRND